MIVDYSCQIPEPEVSILGIDIDPDGAYLAAVNGKVSEVLFLIRAHLN